MCLGGRAPSPRHDGSSQSPSDRCADSEYNPRGQKPQLRYSRHLCSTKPIEAPVPLADAGETNTPSG